MGSLIGLFVLYVIYRVIISRGGGDDNDSGPPGGGGRKIPFAVKVGAAGVAGYAAGKKIAKW